VSNALMTDLYELTMMAGYVADGRAEDEATFDLYFRHPPQGLDLVVAAGLEVALDYLEGLAFAAEDLAYLRDLRRFDEDFIAYLEGLVFSGDVWAMPEGEPVFGDEPILRVTAPLAQAQWVETGLLARICYSSLVASTAVATLLSLEAPEADPVRLHLSAPDGDLDSVLTLIDAIDGMRTPVHAVATAQVGGAAIGAVPPHCFGDREHSYEGIYLANFTI
jgi:nicotinate phosphoribosyltransferase